MQNQLAKDFHFHSLLTYALPTILMMVFMSMYTIVDGIFVSKLVNTNALAAVNIVFPIINVVMAIGIMIGTGGSAITARKMGEGRPGEARQDFTLLVIIGVLLGGVLTITGLVFLDPLLHFLGTNEATYDFGRQYAGLMLLFAVPSILQMLFQMFFVTAGKPALGLTVTILAGCANMLFDYLFIAIFHWGIAGAAIATGIGYLIPSLFGLTWFNVCRKGTLYFVRPIKNRGVILHTFLNGSSEMVTNLSAAIITYLFNIMMMRYLGENGVAAITIVLYIEFFLSAVYLGFSSGIAPILSFNYGEGNIPRLKRLFRISIFFIIGCQAVSFLISVLFAGPLVGLFAPRAGEVFALAVHGFYLYAACYLFRGINIFASSLFTALSDGITSAVLSLMRTFVLILPGLLLLPHIMGADGIWIAVPLAEVLSVILSILCFIRLFRTKLKTSLSLS
ncbi:MAG: MATE family efflux transporter [Clostridiales bacterium]|nr:MATE family efflux transporter [Clostridiales bacterium]